MPGTLKKLVSSLFIIALGFQLIAQNPDIAVFTSGTDGHKSYRIPAIIQIPGGDLLAFAEGRADGSDDFGNIDIVMKRSTDKGKTWSVMTTVVDYQKLQAGNPAERTKQPFKNSRIHVVVMTARFGKVPVLRNRRLAAIDQVHVTRRGRLHDHRLHEVVLPGVTQRAP